MRLRDLPDIICIAFGYVAVEALLVILNHKRDEAGYDALHAWLGCGLTCTYENMKEAARLDGTETPLPELRRFIVGQVANQVTTWIFLAAFVIALILFFWLFTGLFRLVSLVFL